MKWQRLLTGTDGNWEQKRKDSVPSDSIPIAVKKTERNGSQAGDAVFVNYCLGVSTNRDRVVYDFQKAALLKRVASFCEYYNAELDRLKRREERRRFAR